MEQQLPDRTIPNSPRPAFAQDNEVTLREIILKIQEWWGIVWPERSKIVGISMAIGLFAALYVEFLTKPTYTASYQLFFQEESGGLSGAMRLASSFGFSMGATGGSSNITVQEYLTSRDNISKALVAPLEKGRLVDRLFESELRKDEDFALEYSTKFGNDQRYTDSIFSEVFIALNENKIVTATLDEETGVLLFKVDSKDESFAYDLANLLIANAEKKFIDWKKDKSQDAVDAFQSKVDSLETAIDIALVRMGEYEDQNNSLVSSVDKMKRMRLAIDMEALKVAYGEYIKGLEMSKAELMNLEAPFRYFDYPTYPLHRTERSALKVALAVVLSLVVSIPLFLIARRELLNVLRSNSE